MTRALALATLALMAALTAAALVAPPLVALALLAGAIVALRHGRGAFVAFAAVSISINAAILELAGAGWLVGATGGARLSATVGVNLAILSWLRPARLLDALRLPPRPTALLAAVLLGAHDVARDFERLRTARIIEGAWPRGRIARVRAAAALLPALLLAADRRGRIRRDALQLIGHRVGAWFVPLVAIASLAAAGRMAFLALPNVALTYVVVFLGGLLYGPWIAMLAGALGMALTDFLLSGLYPAGFVNVPAMALLGLMGGMLRRFDFVGGSRADRAAGVLFAAFFGLAGTLVFSLATDAATWLLLYRQEPAALAPLLLAGLAFNVIPALVNALLFALSVQPTARAFAAARARAPAPQAAGARTAAREPDAVPPPA